jgi:ABC-type multidrug transport system permease subunit
VDAIAVLSGLAQASFKPKMQPTGALFCPLATATGLTFGMTLIAYLFTHTIGTVQAVVDFLQFYVVALLSYFVFSRLRK